MKFLGNLLWLIFGGLEIAIGYFSASLALAVTIVGIPWAVQTFKLGFLCLWPFGSEVRDCGSPVGCLSIPLNIIWFVFGGWWIFIGHIIFGVLLCITIVGLPWGMQHFKMCALGFAPFGKDVRLGL